MARTLCLLFMIAVLLSGSCHAQSGDSLLSRSVVSMQRWEPLAQSETPSLPSPWMQDRKKKSVLLATGLSLLVPGAGEIYTEHYWLAPLFLSLEGVLWYYAMDYNRRGDEETSAFEKYADDNWSVVLYAKWLNAYAKNFPGGQNTPQIPISTDESLENWERVQWNVMNEVESAIPQFSHRLPPHGDQQYYELIGKYFQYSYGWVDKTPTGDGWSDYHLVSPRFSSYATMRGNANDRYNTASLFVNLIIVNHVLSAVDAAFLAVRWNKDVDLHSRAGVILLPDGTAELRPTTTLSLRF